MGIIAENYPKGLLPRKIQHVQRMQLFFHCTRQERGDVQWIYTSITRRLRGIKLVKMRSHYNVFKKDTISCVFFRFPCSAYHKQDWQPYCTRLMPSLLKVMTTHPHTQIHNAIELSYAELISLYQGSVTTGLFATWTKEKEHAADPLLPPLRPSCCLPHALL